MKRKKRIIKILLTMLILVIVIAVALTCTTKNEKINSMIHTVIAEVEKMSSIKIQGEQEIDGLKISNIEVLTKNGETKITARVINGTGSKIDGTNIQLQIFNEDNNMMYAYGYVKSLNDMQATNINTTINKEIKDVTFIEFSKLEEK